MSEQCACECRCPAVAAAEQCPQYQPKVFGMQYRPRTAEPSMFELLSWNAAGKEPRRTDMQHECRAGHPPTKSMEPPEKYTTHYKAEYPADNLADNQQRVLQRIRQNHQDRTKPITNLIKDRLFYQEQPVKMAKTTSSTSSKKKKQRSQGRTKPQKKPKQKLDEEKDREVIKKRKEKIKQFNRETRNLPNSAFKTYFGKPAFENYGGGNLTGTGHMLSHNVMPHCGENHPKHQETYESALLNGQKFIKPSAELPRKQDENYLGDALQETKSMKNRKPVPFHLEIPKPDLVNSDRFASQLDSSRMIKSQVVSKSVVKPAKPAQTVKPPARAAGAPTKLDQPAQTVKKHPSSAKPTTTKPTDQNKRSKKEAQAKQPEQPPEQQLKFMNERMHFMNELKQKKVRNSRLAYKVTECYPVVQIIGGDNPSPIKPVNPDLINPVNPDLINPKDYKKIDRKWTEKIPAAGKPAEKHIDIRSLFEPAS